MVVPTLAADTAWTECLESLAQQTHREFEVIVVDNSGKSKVRHHDASRIAAKVLEPGTNLGFGAACNLGFRQSGSPFVATINDDAVARPEWLEKLISVIEDNPRAGMCASRVEIRGEHRLDSAGMLIAGDGSSKQRGHGESEDRYPDGSEVLCPSGSAALYRRAMLDEIGMFDESFFLYCEDTDLGLRGRWAGWTCWYVANAVVEHRYSHSAGRASPLKAYLVERNRLFLCLKNLPARLLWRVPFYSLARYFWHAVLLPRGIGKAAEFRQSGMGTLALAGYVVRAHAAMIAAAPRLWRDRRRTFARARVAPAEFTNLLRRHWISPRQVAAL